MKANFEDCLNEVLTHEGGFVDHPRDPGGATNKGITLATFQRWRKGATVADLKNISDADVKAIYRQWYWNAVKGDQLPDGLDLVAFDAAVNSGPSRGIRWLQSAIGATTDGKMGPQTIAKAKEHATDPDAINKACNARLDFLRGLSHWDAFGKGWSRRVTSVRHEALDMMQSPKPATEHKPALTIDADAFKSGVLQILSFKGIIAAIAALFGKGAR